MFRNFWVGSDGEFVFYSHIYFSFFDCEVKLVLHVIKCHSYKFRTCSYMFVHVRTCSYMFVHVHTCSYMFVHVRTYSYMFVHIRTCSYMNDLRPPPPPPFTRLFTSGPFQFPFFNKGKVNGGGMGGGGVEDDSQVNT